MRPVLRWVNTWKVNVCKCEKVSNTLDAFPNNYNTHHTCPRWMASSPVLVSSLESPSGLKTIYGCKENQNVQFGLKNSFNTLFSGVKISNEQEKFYLCFHSPCSCSGLKLPLSLHKEKSAVTGRIHFSTFYYHIIA